MKILVAILCVICVRSSLHAQRPDANSGQQVYVPAKKNGVMIPARATNDRPASEDVGWERRPYFVPFKKKQADWNVIPDLPMHPGYSLPVYSVDAPRPYLVLGNIWFRLPPESKDPWTEAIRLAARDAKAHGADALLVMPPAPGYENEFFQVSVAVKWRTDRVIHELGTNFKPAK